MSRIAAVLRSRLFAELSLMWTAFVLGILVLLGGPIRLILAVGFLLILIRIDMVAEEVRDHDRRSS